MVIKLYEEFVATLPKIDMMNQETDTMVKPATRPKSNQTKLSPKKIEPSDIKYDGGVYTISGWNMY